MPGDDRGYVISCMRGGAWIELWSAITLMHRATHVVTRAVQVRSGDSLQVVREDTVRSSTDQE